MADDVHLLVGAYAVGALDEVEERDFAEHLERCAACSAELRELLETAALLGAAEHVDPPAHLRASVLAAAATTRQLAPVVVPLARPSRGRLGRAQRALAVAAGIALLGGVAGLGLQTLRLDQRLDEARARDAVVAAVLAAPDAQVASADASVGGRGVVVRSPATGRAVFLATDLPELPADRVYQLWYVGEGDPAPAGLLAAGEPARVLDPPTDTALVAVTVEPEGGSPAPTTEPLLAVPLAA